MDDGKRYTQLEPHPSDSYDLITKFGDDGNVAVIADLLKLIPLFYAPSPKYNLTGAIKHQLEHAKDDGYTDVNNGNFHRLVDPYNSPLYVSREQCILAMLMMELPFKFNPTSWCFFSFKGKQRPRVQNATLESYKKMNGIHDSCPWSRKVQYTIKPMARVRLFMMLICTQRILRRRSRSLPTELWVEHILPHFTLGMLSKPAHGRSFYRLSE
ncbi:MAG: hypothetical protein WCO49_20445 [Nostocales cyanobacterium ELA608]